MNDPMRPQMVAALAEFLGIDAKLASDAMDHVWEATKGVVGGAPPSWQPDLTDPGQALAHRVQKALGHEFDGEPLFPCVVVVQHEGSGRVGLAATAIGLDEVDHLLLLGRGAAKRAVRQHGAP